MNVRDGKAFGRTGGGGKTGATTFGNTGPIAGGTTGIFMIGFCTTKGKTSRF